MPARPIDNKVDYDVRGKMRFWFQCVCGWKTRKRRLPRHVRPPRSVVFKPFVCPKCGAACGKTTIYD